MEKHEIMSTLMLELRRGTIVLCVLSQLSKPMYGYSLVDVLSKSEIIIETNTLYPLLRRLESQGLLKSQWETTTSKPRKYYSITEMGKEVLEELKEHWNKTVKNMNKLWEVNGNEECFN